MRTVKLCKKLRSQTTHTSAGPGTPLGGGPHAINVAEVRPKSELTVSKMCKSSAWFRANVITPNYGSMGEAVAHQATHAVGSSEHSIDVLRVWVCVRIHHDD